MIIKENVIKNKNFWFPKKIIRDTKKLVHTSIVIFRCYITITRDFIVQKSEGGKINLLVTVMRVYEVIKQFVNE